MFKRPVAVGNKTMLESVRVSLRTRVINTRSLCASLALLVPQQMWPYVSVRVSVAAALEPEDHPKLATHLAARHTRAARTKRTAPHFDGTRS